MLLSVPERFQRRRVGGGGREQRRQRPRRKESCREQETGGSPETERDRNTETQRQREMTDPGKAGRDTGSGRDREAREHPTKELMRTERWTESERDGDDEGERETKPRAGTRT